MGKRLRKTSGSLKTWETSGASTLDGLVALHRATKGAAGRQDVVRAYATIVAAVFQAFCRDLHSEVADHFAQATNAVPPTSVSLALSALMKDSLTRNRFLDGGNATSDNLKKDFKRFALPMGFWELVAARDKKRHATHKQSLSDLNDCRNGIVHHNVGVAAVRLSNVHRWRKSCAALALSFDAVMRAHLTTALGKAPW